MDTQLLIICVLTFVIHLIGTLAYAAWGPVAWIMWRIRRMVFKSALPAVEKSG